MRNDSSPEPQPSDLSVATWMRTPFGPRGERSRPTRPRVDHGHEVVRHQPPPFV